MNIIVDNRLNFTSTAVPLFTTKSKWHPNQSIQRYELSIKIAEKNIYEFMQYAWVGLSVSMESDERIYFITDSHVRGGQLPSPFSVRDDVNAELILSISEPDTEPSFSEIELGGHTFQVLGYKVESDDEVSVHSFLLTLEKEDFSLLERVIELIDTSTDVKRLGVDQTYLECYLGSESYWSNQQDSCEGRKLRVVNCIFKDMRFELQDEDTSLIRYFNLERKVGILSMQMEYLLSRFEKVLSREDLEILRSPDSLETVIDNTHYWTELEYVNDASKWFNG